MKKALNKAKYKFHHDFVEYYDKEKYSGNLDPFKKSLEYEHQNEFRFFVENLANEPITIKIGSMKKYSQIYTVEDMMGLQLRVN